MHAATLVSFSTPPHKHRQTNSHQLSALFTLAATVVAAPNPAVAELAARQGATACDKGYYPCVQLQQFACPIACLSVPNPIGKLACTQRCSQTAHANCRAWCG